MTVHRNRSGRVGVFFWVGLVLWICVFAGLFVIRRSQQSAAPPSMKLELRSDDPKIAPQTVSIDMSQGEATVDIGKLMAGSAKSVALRPDGQSAVRNHADIDADTIWSPDGIEDFSLTNCDGRTITKADLLGRPWAVAFVFTHCIGPCPTVTRKMKDLQDQLKEDDVRLVLLTVDPKRDTPEVLKKYAEQNGADLAKWFFLTGDATQIYGLIHRSFLMPVQEVPEADGGYDVIHSIWVLLVDEKGIVRAKYNAAKDNEMAQLRRELQKRARVLAGTAPADAEAPVVP
jgi:protein SCO1